MGFDTEFWMSLKTEFTNIKSQVETRVPILMFANPNVKSKLGPALEDTKIDISIDELDVDGQDNADNSDMKNAINWLGNMIKKLRLRTEESRRFLQEIFGLLNQFADQITQVRVKTEDLDRQLADVMAAKEASEEAMRTKTELLEKQLDEARQRGLKGNIIVSSPNLPAKNPGQSDRQSIRKLLRQGDTAGVESDLDYSLRLIAMKTGVRAPKEDIGACHVLPSKPNQEPSYIITFVNRKEDSAWDAITSCMMAGGCQNKRFSMNPEVNVFLNFQVTKARAELAKIVRKARFEGKFDREGINTNGQVRAKIAGRWKVVESEAHLEELTRNLPATARTGRDPRRSTRTRPGPRDRLSISPPRNSQGRR